jgi:CobQ/CobB/MinD/ParA nucleotide binding domain
VKTVTFYSYKGGTGRSLLLANTAHYLARLGHRVVAVDFDFEAPGLHYKLNIIPPTQRPVDTVPERGAVDYLLAAAQGESPPESLLDYVVPVPLPLGTKGSLHLMPAGSAPTGEYWKALTNLLRQDLFTNPEGSGLAAFLELKARIEEELQADFLLIDSRTGVTELAGLTTTVLADKIVCLLLANRESQTGARAVLRSLRHAPRLAGHSPIEIIPVLSRVPVRDEATVQEVLSFLNAPSLTPEDTLTLEQVFVLRTDMKLARGEKLYLDSGESQVRSPLHEDYLALMGKLVEADPGQIAELMRLQSMPSLPAISLPPPRDWQSFEDLCCDLMRQVWNDPYTQKNGRSGQRQKGIDILGQPNQENDWAGMQCKLKDQLTGGRLSLAEIENEIEQARSFRPPLKRLIIATTISRDASLQEELRKIDERERLAGSFSVAIFFWEDILSKLGDFPELAQKHYPQFFFPSPGHRLSESAADTGRLSGLQVAVAPDEDLDFVGLLPAFSAIERDIADLALLTVHLSDIEIINHDEKPTKILRLWLDIAAPSGPPLEIKEEVLTGNPWIEARSHRRFELRFAALFEGAPPQDWRQRVILRVNATGFSEIRIPLEPFP